MKYMTYSIAEMSVFLYLGLAVPGFDHDFNLSLVLSALVTKQNPPQKKEKN